MGVGRALIVGSGGREHALAWACLRDAPDVAIIVAPGNSGTADIAENVAVNVTDAAAVARLAAERAVDLVIIGPDAAAAAGVADACNARDIPVFGPTAAAARIESSKTFAKQVMDAAGIPTARWVAGEATDRQRLSAFIADLGGVCVVKADGLALGKGVVVCAGVEEAERALDDCFGELRFGDAGRQVVVEELLSGVEVSVFGLSDGRNVRTLVPARDYKRIFDGDRGANTGGMGAIAPPPDAASSGFVEEMTRTVLGPCIAALREQGHPFVGCLYAGLMLTTDGVRVLEFNARFGDPETQVVLPLLDEPLLDVLTACACRPWCRGRRGRGCRRLPRRRAPGRCDHRDRIARRRCLLLSRWNRAGPRRHAAVGRRPRALRHRDRAGCRGRAGSRVWQSCARAL
jgi:phosphoribosylamine--glycine ligase